MSTDIRAIVRDRIHALGVGPTAVAEWIAEPWGCSVASAATTLHEDFLGGHARLKMAALPALLTALFLRIEPGPPQVTDLREIVRAAVPRDERDRYAWAAVAERLLWYKPDGKPLSKKRIVETLSKAFGPQPSRGIYLDKVGPLLDALNLRIVPMEPGEA